MNEDLHYEYAYDISKREYYLAELFNSEEPVPFWALNKSKGILKG